MLAIEFPGCNSLVSAIDRAVCHDCPSEITNELRNSLCKLIRDPDVKLPDCCYQSAGDHYARRELYRSDTHGYTVIAMTWGPGQGTLIHDHAGMWCVEGVWHGSLEITPYEMMGERDGKYRFESRGTMNVGPGSAGSLIPPHEFHTIRNPADDAIAVTLHVYRGPMTECSVFRPVENHWYVRDQRQLSLDATH
jgi:predicted metal-dependent enzyme (double-stranded beta helix superfamily)